MRKAKIYIHEHKDWPNFVWDNAAILQKLGEVRNLQGRILGKMEGLGFDLRNQAILETLTLDIAKSTEIEGEHFDPVQVRSSLARKLGVKMAGMVDAESKVEGMVEMMMDATQQYGQELSAKRLFNWQAALFPTGRNLLYKITTGAWRKDTTGPMQVVSGAVGKEKIHFEAPHSKLLPGEMKKFITWFNKEKDLDPVLKAAVAHFWFVTIHPFDDGNGRIARALTDMLLARADKSPQRFYSMSAAIRKDRKTYYEILERSQKGNTDITKWLTWFLQCLMNALNSTESALSGVFKKSEFWKKHAKTPLNERQRKMLNKLFDGFEGKLNTSKWAKINKCSSDTALRDIQDLIAKGILKKEKEGGRSTNYELK